jgi:RNA polymerase sigma-70 factor (ECF subfamily)
MSIEARLRQLFDDGRAAWPGIAVDSTTFARHFQERWRDTLPRAPDAAELYLACACAQGAAGALAAFDRTYLSRVDQYLHRLKPSAAFADDVRQTIREKLFVGATARIGEYNGRGSLEGWVRVMALRVAIDLGRRRGENLPDLAAQGTPPADDPELDFIKRRYRPHFVAALQHAIEQLSSEHRLWLRMHFVDGVTLDELAAGMRVHRVTAARRIAAARRAVMTSVRHLLRERLTLKDAELESLIGLVQSNLDVSLSRFLATAE